MVYGILKLLNFAHGDVFMIGAYIGFGVLQLLRGRREPEHPDLARDPADGARRDGRLRGGRGHDRALRLPAARDAPRIAPLISALGVSFFLQYSVQLLFGAQHKTTTRSSWTAARSLRAVFAWGPLDVSLLR